MKFYGVADYDFDGGDRLRGVFYSTLEDAVTAPNFDSGSIDVFDGNPPRRVDSYDVHTVELYEVISYLGRYKSDDALFFTINNTQWGDEEDMLMIVRPQQ